MSRQKSRSLITAVILAMGAQAMAGVPDPQRGYQFLVNGNYEGIGIPVSYLERMSVGYDLLPDPIKSLLGCLFGANIPGEHVFEDPGIPGREGTNAGLARNLNAYITKRGGEVANGNCLQCHSEKIGDQVIVGLGNTTADYTQDASKGTWLLKMGALPSESKETDLVAGVTDAVGSAVVMKTRGVNPALGLTYNLMAHRDPVTLAWSDQPVLEPLPADRNPPVRVPAWWHMSKRKTMFYSGEVKGDLHRVMMLASLSGVEGLDDAEALDEPFQDVEGYIRAIQPPKYPLAINTLMAARGQEVFGQTCVRCHGTYGPGGSYPERIVPLDVVGTDPMLAELETGSESERFRDWSDRSFYGALTEHELTAGYLAPPLDGVWATAPYFHNGSVPTLEAVLNSRLRPKYWTRSFNSKDYDVARPGWAYQELKTGQSSPLNIFRKEDIYDTTLPGYSNAGHLFGDNLPDSDRKAVIEYLKTL